MSFSCFLFFKFFVLIFLFFRWILFDISYFFFEFLVAFFFPFKSMISYATCTNMPTPDQDAEDLPRPKELPKKKTLIVKSYFDDEAQEIIDLKGKKKTTNNSKKK